jgi:manganese transport protein
MSHPTLEPYQDAGWRVRRGQSSLPEVFRSVSIPKAGWGVGFLRKLLAFSGPGHFVRGRLHGPG